MKRSFILCALALLSGCYTEDTFIMSSAEETRWQLTNRMVQWTHPGSGCVYNVISYKDVQSTVISVFVDRRSDGQPNCPDAPEENIDG